ncbi:hypothetical protein [Sphingomonas sp. 3-13AW]|uniref:hypothetical protein n=1 Tax=Sphingomonas sp. 3-13AW TaxID=3050450 RepID=UPI003BB6714C
MSKIIFSKVEKGLPHPMYDLHHSREFIRCDLARPKAELEAIAALMTTVVWIEDPMVLDATLYISSRYNVPFEFEERALHPLLKIARDVLAEGTAALPVELTKPWQRPEPCKDLWCPRPSAYVSAPEDPQKLVKYAMPAGCYEPAMLVSEIEGRFVGFFLTSDRHSRPEKKLAASLIALSTPEARVEPTPEHVHGDVYVGNPIDGIEGIGAACLKVAIGTIAAMKDRVRRLLYEGHPSAFLDEDNDARDVLLSLMAEGATLECTPAEDRSDDFFDLEPYARYRFADGTEAPYHLVQRLRQAGLVHPADGEWGRSSTFVAADCLRKSALQPRSEAVSFDLFQSGCRFRRYPDDGERECSAPNRGGCNADCMAEYCPLLKRVYEAEYGDSFRRFGSLVDEPAFEFHHLDQRPDPLMAAIHPNTRRSFAWRNAGSDRMFGIINQVLGSHLTYGVPLLVEALHEAAVDRAVAEGWLAVDDRNALGAVVRVTDKLLGEVDRQREARETVTVA